MLSIRAQHLIYPQRRIDLVGKTVVDRIAKGVSLLQRKRQDRLTWFLIVDWIWSDIKLSSSDELAGDSQERSGGSGRQTLDLVEPAGNMRNRFYPKLVWS